VFTPKKCVFNQREVGNDTHAFHDALRNAMRQAPDCILIGEIRDQETMRMALTYALSGTCAWPPARQQFLPGDEPRDQLLPAGSAPDAAAGPLRVPEGHRLAAPGEDGRGQAHAGVEVLLNTRNVQEAIEKGEVGEVKEMMEKSMSPGSQTFEQDLFRLVRQGKISTDEALANADSATNLGLLLGNSESCGHGERVKNPIRARKGLGGRPSASSRSRRSPPSRGSADRGEEPRGKPHAIRGVPCDRRNIATHFIGIPLIVFAAVLPRLVSFTAGGVPVSLAAVASVAAFAYYLRLDGAFGAAMAVTLFLMCAAASEVTPGCRRRRAGNCRRDLRRRLGLQFWATGSRA